MAVGGDGTDANVATKFWFSISNDNGVTWSVPSNIPVTTGNNTSYFKIGISSGNNPGEYIICYYSDSNLSGNNIMITTDYGVTWSNRSNVFVSVNSGNGILPESYFYSRTLNASFMADPNYIGTYQVSTGLFLNNSYQTLSVSGFGYVSRFHESPDGSAVIGITDSSGYSKIIRITSPTVAGTIYDFLTGSRITNIVNVGNDMYLQSGSLIFKSTDQGATWNSISSSPVGLGAIFYFNNNFFIVNGNNIATSTDGGITWNQSQISSNFFTTTSGFNILQASNRIFLNSASAHNMNIYEFNDPNLNIRLPTLTDTPNTNDTALKYFIKVK